MVITLEDGVLVVKFGNLSSALEHYDQDIFEAKFIPGRVHRISFAATSKEGVTILSVAGFETVFAKNR